MELKYFVVKEEVNKQRVLIDHIKTDLMVVDPLTKGLQPNLLKEHIHKIGLGCNDD